MIDKNSGLLLGVPHRIPDADIVHPTTGEAYKIPRVAVEMLSDHIAGGLIQAIVQNVTFNVVSNVMRLLGDRCHAPSCGVTRVTHNEPDHDFVEPPRPEVAPDGSTT